MARVHRTNYNRGYRERAPETWRKHLFSSLLNGDQSLRKRKRPKGEAYNLPIAKETVPSSDRARKPQLPRAEGPLHSHIIYCSVTMRRNVFSIDLGSLKQDLERPNALIKFYVY